jgi:hypothetical protein
MVARHQLGGQTEAVSGGPGGENTLGEPIPASLQAPLIAKMAARITGQVGT